MKRNIIFILFGIIILLTACLATAADKQAPLTGTWDCQSKGGPDGPMTFTLRLQQDGENVSGNVSSPIGDAQISSGTFKQNSLEIHINTEDGNYILLAKFDKGTLSGTWTHNNEKGTWEGSRSAPK
jgi:hypothetical protein